MVSVVKLCRNFGMKKAAILPTLLKNWPSNSLKSLGITRKTVGLTSGLSSTRCFYCEATPPVSQKTLAMPTRRPEKSAFFTLSRRLKRSHRARHQRNIVSSVRENAAKHLDQKER